MGSILEKIAEWFKELLIEGITSNLSGMFDTVNQKVGEIAGQVGQTPSAFKEYRLLKEFYNCLLESVEIYDEPLPSGRILKKLTFRFPLLYGEEEITGIGWDKVNHVETVVLMSKVKG